MILLILKIYETFYILVVNCLKFINFFLQNSKLNRFLSLRDSNRFLSVVKQANSRFQLIKAKEPEARVFWVHVSSAGELEQAIPVAKLLHEKMQVYFFVTYYSYSAEPFLKNFPAQLAVSGLPVDQISIYQKAFSILKFQKLFFIRYDLWPSLIEFGSQAGLEMYLIGAMSAKTKSGFLGFISRKWSHHLYKKFKTIFVTTENDLQIFKKEFPKNHIVLAGDSKWLRAKERAQKFIDDLEKKQNLDQNRKEFLETYLHVRGLIKTLNKKSLLFGSPHKEEHTIALQVAEEISSILSIYVPHSVSSKSLDNLSADLDKKHISYCYYSKISEFDHKRLKNLQMIIVDQMGNLAELYTLADLAIIGGGFDGKIHNILEASAHAVPVLIGDKTSRAPEVEVVLTAGAAFAFLSPNLLFQFIRQWGNLEGNMKKLQSAKQQAKKLFEHTLNTNEIILNTLLQENQIYAHKTTHYKHHRL